MRRAMWGVWGLSLACVVVFAAASYGRLPSKFAVHFDARGRPNSWTSRGTFYLVWALTVGAGNAIPLLAAAAVSSSFKRDPAKVSIPRKDHWLATPERIAEASGIMRAGMAGCAAACNILFLQIFMVVRDHALTATHHPMSWTIFAPFGVVLALAIAYMIGSLYRTGDARE